MKTATQVTIYYNAEKTISQVCRPTSDFGGNWAGLVEGITKGMYHSYKVS